MAEAIDLSAFPPPPVEKLKDMCIETVLVSNGKPAGIIVAPDEDKYQAWAREIQGAIHKTIGALLPIRKPEQVKLPLATNAIILGNRSTNDLMRRLYDLYYTYLDLKYPGAGGYVVRSLHNPFGNKVNAILVGSSDDAGMSQAVAQFVSIVRKAAKNKSLKLGWTMEIKLGAGLKAPEDADNVHAWEESVMYPGATYFGWNSISRRLALYSKPGNARFPGAPRCLVFPAGMSTKLLWNVDG